MLELFQCVYKMLHITRPISYGPYIYHRRVKYISFPGTFKIVLSCWKCLRGKEQTLFRCSTVFRETTQKCTIIGFLVAEQLYKHRRVYVCLFVCLSVTHFLWCHWLDGYDALIGQRGNSVQLYSTVHLGQCTVLVYTHNSNSPHNTLSKLAWVSTVQ